MRVSQRGPRGVSNIDTIRHRSFMSSHNMNPPYIPPPLHLPLLSTHRSHLDSQLSPPRLKPFPPSALLLYSALGWISPDCPPSNPPFSPRILRRPLLPSSAGQEIHRHQISHARFSRSFVSRLPPQLLPGSEEGRDLLGMLSRSGQGSSSL